MAPTSCGLARHGPCSTASPRVYTEGRDDAPSDDDGGRCRTQRGRHDAVRGRHDDPALHRAAAAIHRGDPHQGARGARIGRPSTYAATISTIVDRGYVVREHRLHPEPVSEVVVDLLVEHFGDSWTSRSRRGWRRPGRHRPRRAAVGAAAPRPSTHRFGSGSTRSVRRPGGGRERLHDGSDGRGLLASATRWSSGSAATGASWPARCTRSTRRSRPLPGDEPPPQDGDAARSAPSAARGRSSASAAGSGRSSAARATPTATTSRRTVRRRPTRSPFEVVCPKNKDGHLVAASRAADRQRLLGLLELPEVRLHDEPRAAWRLSRHSRMAPLARKGDEAICLVCGSTIDAAARRDRPGPAVSGWAAQPRGARPSRHAAGHVQPARRRVPRRPPRARRKRGKGALKRPHHDRACRHRRRRRPSRMNSGSRGCRRERVRSSRPPTRERGSGRPNDRERD